MAEEKDFLEIVKEISKSSRLAGSKGESEIFDFLKNRIKKEIGGKVNIQKYKILTWREIEKPELIIGGMNLDCRSVYYSPSVKIKGKLEYFGENDSEKGNEFEVFSVRDNKKNILALINISRNFSDPFYYSKGSADYLLPNLIVGSKSEKIIKENVGKNVEIKIKSKFVVKKSNNLVHKISNRKNKLKLLVCAHVDTVPHSRGVIDDASGVAASIILSEKIKKTKLPFDVWMVYFGAEENSMFGSKFFVETLTNDEKRCIRYVISLDGLGMKDGVSIYAENDYFEQIDKAFEKMGDKLQLSDVEDSFDTSDHYYFKLMGIDSCLVEGKTGGFYCHSKEADKLENFNVELCNQTIKSIFEYIKNIEFKSPIVDFDRNRKTFFNKVMKIIRKIR